jgi:hypothetical protein
VWRRQAAPCRATATCAAFLGLECHLILRKSEATCAWPAAGGSSSAPGMPGVLTVMIRAHMITFETSQDLACYQRFRRFATSCAHCTSHQQHHQAQAKPTRTRTVEKPQILNCFEILSLAPVYLLACTVDPTGAAFHDACRWCKVTAGCMGQWPSQRSLQRS